VRRKKRNLEKVEALDRSTMDQPPIVDAKFCFSLLAKRQAQPENSERIISEAKTDLMILLDRINDRWKNAPPLPVPQLDMTCPGLDLNTSSANRGGEPDVPLFELLKQTKLLLVKASKK
jgi:hypothetical protein